MIDNFELIKPMFYFNEVDNMFFHCQIIQRTKDHKEEKVKKLLKLKKRRGNHEKK